MMGERERRIILGTKLQEAKMDHNTCYDCTGVVSTLVRACPHCGAPKLDNWESQGAYQAGPQSRELPEALGWAVSKGNTQAVETFLRRIPDCKTNTCDWSGALFWASRFGSVKMGRYCVNNGADVDFRGTGGRTPLIESAGCGQLKFVEMLLEEGANIHLEDQSGTTALSRAAS